MGSFPSHVGKEVGQTFLKLEKVPDFVKTEHVFNTAAGEITFFTIYQIEDETRYFEGLKAIIKRFSGYMDIEGYKYTLYPVLEAKDALSMIGLG
ncbi:MAG: hypothetical protein ACFE8V_15745 [Promethearchaeota archaeon]